METKINFRNMHNILINQMHVSSDLVMKRILMGRAADPNSNLKNKFNVDLNGINYDIKFINFNLKYITLNR